MEMHLVLLPLVMSLFPYRHTSGKQTNFALYHDSLNNSVKSTLRKVLSINAYEMEDLYFFLHIQNSGKLFVSELAHFGFMGRTKVSRLQTYCVKDISNSGQLPTSRGVATTSDQIYWFYEVKPLSTIPNHFYYKLISLLNPSGRVDSVSSYCTGGLLLKPEHPSSAKCM